MNTDRMNKYYFASDVHLGLPPNEKEREKQFTQWLDFAKRDAKTIFLLGDIFDFWFEYKKTVPRGFVRTLGKIAEITDSGVEVHFIPGNHDLWIRDYLAVEAGVTIHGRVLQTVLNGKIFFLSHGDALNISDKKHMMLLKVFTNPVMRKLYAALHPRWGLGLAHAWSQSSAKQNKVSLPFGGEDEALYLFAKQKLEEEKIDHFIFGHLHSLGKIPVGKDSTFTVLPEWKSGGGYAVFDGNELNLISL